jgi:hypothetical protein
MLTMNAKALVNADRLAAGALFLAAAIAAFP